MRVEEEGGRRKEEEGDEYGAVHGKDEDKGRRR